MEPDASFKTVESAGAMMAQCWSVSVESVAMRAADDSMNHRGGDAANHFTDRPRPPPRIHSSSQGKSLRRRNGN
jgi:hypothetical protein